MKRLVVVMLLLVLATSFVTGLLLSRSEAAGCRFYCEKCTCSKIQCCAGVCTVVGQCWPVCPACPPPA